MPQSWSIIVFCFDEKDTVAQVMNAATEIGATLSGGDFEVIVVDDGSRDGSAGIIAEKSKLLPGCKVITHEKNLGIGHALQSGYSSASKENVVAIPADDQFDCRELLPFAQLNDDEFISFYRVENLHYSPFRNFLSFYNKKLIEWFCGNLLKDVNWIKIYKLHHLRSAAPRMRSSLIESEITSKLIRMQIGFREIRSVYRKRTGGSNKGGSWRVVSQAIFEMPRLISAVRKFRVPLRASETRTGSKEK